MNNPITRTLVGIDIAGSDLRIAILRSSLGKLRLIGTFAVDGFRHMDRGAQKVELTKIATRHQLEGRGILLSLPPESGLVRQLEFPIEAAADLRAAVELQIESLSPWPVEEIYWDIAWRKIVRGEKRVRVTVAIALGQSLDQWLELFAGAGLHLAGASVAPLVWGHAAAALWGDDLPTMLLNLEPEGVEGALIRKDTLGATGVSDGESTEDRVRRVALELMRVGRVRSPDKVRVLTFGPDADGLDTHNAALPIEGATSGSSRAFGAIAAALGGRGADSFSLNLVPEEQRYRSNQRQRVPTYAGLVLVLLAATALFVREPYQWGAYAAELDRAIAAVAPGVSDLTDQESELNALADRYRALGIHLTNRDRTLGAFDALVGVIPLDTWLTSFTLESGNVTVSGFSASAAEVQRLVEESEFFQDAEFIASVVRDDMGRDRFTLRVNLEDPS